eukprot:XP_017945146.1 PREDICTED: uncharacterized protein LOC108644818 [Xenopus tropicalis]
MSAITPEGVKMWALQEGLTLPCAFVIDHIPLQLPNGVLEQALSPYPGLAGAAIVTSSPSPLQGLKQVLCVAQSELKRDSLPAVIYPDSISQRGWPAIYPPAIPAIHLQCSSSPMAVQPDSCSILIENDTSYIPPQYPILEWVPPPVLPQLSTSLDTIAPVFAESIQKVTEASIRLWQETVWSVKKYFSGNEPVPKGEEVFSEWIEYIRPLLEEWEGTDKMKQRRLMELVRHPALIFLQAQKTKQPDCTVHDLLQALINRYEKYEDPQQRLAKFQAMRQSKGEKASAFICRVSNELNYLIFKKIIPAAQEISHLHRQVKWGSDPKHPVNLAVQSYLRYNPNASTGDLLRTAEEEEARIDFYYASSTHDSELKEKEKPSTAQSQTVPQPAKSKSPEAPQFPKTTKPYCRRCQTQGHDTNKCYRKVQATPVQSQVGECNSSRHKERKPDHPTPIVGVGRKCIFHLTVNGVPSTALFDTGSQITIICRPFYQEHLSHLPLIPADDIEVVGVGAESAYMDGKVEVDLRIPGITSEAEPPLKVFAYICPPMDLRTSAPIIVGSNVKAVEDAFLKFLHLQGTTDVSSFPVSAAVKKLCEAFVPEFCQGPVYRVNGPPLEIPAGQAQLIQVSRSLPIECDTESYFLLETPPEQVAKHGWELIPERKDWRQGMPEFDWVVLQNHNPWPITVSEFDEVGECYSVQEVTSESEVCSAHIEPKDAPLNFDFGDSPMPKEAKELLIKELTIREDVFSTEDMDVGCAKSACHTIRLADSKPFRERSRKLPPRDIEDVRKCLKKMKDQNIITDSRSPYASPIVVVRKKDGSVRLCVDYRTLNRRTIPDQYTLPRIEDSLEALSGSKWFTVMDLRSGYYQVPMCPEDQEKTAFICPLGFYQFTRMPQGICGAPATFQRLMEKVLGDLCPRECLVYLDDIIVFGSTLEEHHERLIRVIDRLQEECLKLSIDKCKFGRTSVHYVGHIVSAEGVATDPAKIEAVVNWPQPNNLTELRSFLGFCGYYRRFVEGYSKLAKPLHTLLTIPSTEEKVTKNSKLPFGDKWTDACTQAFAALKKCLTEAPVLAYADPTKPYILLVDASYDGLGGVLHQEYPGGLRPVAYISRSLAASEKNYPVHKLEFLALKWAIVDKLHGYLYGVPFEVRTDNNPLTYVHTTAKLDATGQRWLAALSNYQFTLKYKPGPKNVGADALSRRPGLPATTDNEEWTEISTSGVNAFCLASAVNRRKLNFSDLRVVDSLGARPECVPDAFCCPALLGIDQLHPLKKKDLIRAQIADPIIGPLRKAVLQKDQEYLKLREWEKFQIESGLLYRVVLYHDHPDRRQFVLPKRYQQFVLRNLHDKNGHLGTEKTYGLIQDRFYWPKMRETVTDYCRRCLRCLQRKTLPIKAAPLEHLKSSGPLDLVCMDFLCIDPDSKGVGNILVVTDHYTRYAQAFPTKDQKAATVAKVLWEKFFIHYGLPVRLHSDQGRDFESKLIKELLQMLNISKSRTTPYHPQGDAQPERFNRTLLNMLGTLNVKEKRFWSRHVSTMVHAYNCTRHETTGYSPYFLMFGREARLPIDLYFGVSVDGMGSISHSQYVAKLKDDLSKAYRLAEGNASKTNQGNKRRYDARVRHNELVPGDRVLLRNLGNNAQHKLSDRWRTDFYVVVDKLPGIPVYRIKGPRGYLKAWHRNHLLPIPQVSDSETEDQTGSTVSDGSSCAGNSPNNFDVSVNSPASLNADNDDEQPTIAPTNSHDDPPSSTRLSPNTPAFVPATQPGLNQTQNSVNPASGLPARDVRRGRRIRRPPSALTYDSLGVPNYTSQPFVGYASPYQCGLNVPCVADVQNLLREMYQMMSRLSSMMSVNYY